MPRPTRHPRRRPVRYETLSEMLRDAERLASLAASEVEMRGTWSLGQVLHHVALSLDASLEEPATVVPESLQWLLALCFKRRFLSASLPAGLTTIDLLTPTVRSAEEGLDALRGAVERQSRTVRRTRHPGLGRLSAGEWTQFHLRHAELHMSFAHSANDTVTRRLVAHPTNSTSDTTEREARSA